MITSCHDLHDLIGARFMRQLAADVYGSKREHTVGNEAVQLYCLFFFDLLYAKGQQSFTFLFTSFGI